MPETPAPPPLSRANRPLFARLLIGLLLGILGLALYLSLNPPALAGLLRAAPIPGSVAIPTPGPTPPMPEIVASPGPLPTGFQAYTGVFSGGTISCGFLLDLGDTPGTPTPARPEGIPGVSAAQRGRRVGVTAAHSSLRLPPGVPAEFRLPAGEAGTDRVALLPGQLGFGQTFIGDRFTLDYVLWAVDPAVDPARFLSPDPRPLPQPGEPVYLYAPAADGTGGPLRRAGVVISASANAIWVQLADSFSPTGYSGCPVVSRVTGRLIGMAVAGADLPLEVGGAAVVIGLHPAASLVEKAKAIFPGP